MMRLTLAAGGASREETSDEVAVLHFTYNKFDDLKSRRDRCDCAPTEEDAKRCFILPFDRMVRSRPPLLHHHCLTRAASEICTACVTFRMLSLSSGICHA